MQFKKQQLELYKEQRTGSKLGKEYIKVVYCYPAYLASMQITSLKCWTGWITSWNHDFREKYQQLQRGRWYHPSGRKQRETKEPFDESERGEWKSWPKTQYSKTKIMASGPITSCQIDGETMETVTAFTFLGSKILADGDCSHEIKRHLLLGRKAMTKVHGVSEGRTWLSDWTELN